MTLHLYCRLLSDAPFACKWPPFSFHACWHPADMIWVCLQSYNSIAMNLDFALITLKYAADVVRSPLQHAVLCVSNARICDVVWILLWPLREVPKKFSNRQPTQ